MTTNNEHIPEGYYSEEQVAALLGKAVSSLRGDQSKRKGPPKTKLGRKVIYSKESFEEWLKQKETKPINRRRS